MGTQSTLREARIPMPLIVLVIVSAAAGVLVAFAASRLPRAGGRDGPPRLGFAARFDPEAATGLALSLALIVLAFGGIVLAVLALLVRDADAGLGIDRSAADWGATHSTTFTHDVLEAFTNLGKPGVVAAMAVVLAVVETIRTRSRWVAPFLLIVVGGNGLITTTIKQLDDRVRPTIDPIASTLGPSFPSGHSSWSAAFFAAAALLLSRGRSRRVRIALSGLAAGLAVAVAASRVLLGVHWLTDVLAGLAVGWAWFAACSIAFGGRLLEFGAAVRPEPGRGATARRDLLRDT
jgi:membrane-associated phospholipid phosphatase